jgi:hypothetical protein
MHRALRAGNVESEPLLMAIGKNSDCAKTNPASHFHIKKRGLI